MSRRGTEAMMLHYHENCSHDTILKSDLKKILRGKCYLQLVKYSITHDAVSKKNIQNLYLHV